MKAAMRDSVLIEQVVYLASKARVATGQDPIFDMPKGRHQTSSCPIQRALNLNCSVTSSRISFGKRAHAEVVAEVCGLVVQGAAVEIPPGHPFRAFVNRFDHGKEKHLKQLELGR